MSVWLYVRPNFSTTPPNRILTVFPAAAKSVGRPPAWAPPPPSCKPEHFFGVIGRPLTLVPPRDNFTLSMSETGQAMQILGLSFAPTRFRSRRQTEPASNMAIPSAGQ